MSQERAGDARHIGSIANVGQGIQWEQSGEPNTPFSKEEIGEITLAVSNTKVQLEKLRLLPAQLQLVEGKLDYVAEKAKTLGRVDWKNLFVGTIISLVVQYAIPPQVARTIWMIVGETFKRVILIALR